MLLVGLLGDFFSLFPTLSNVHGIGGALSIWFVVEFFKVQKINRRKDEKKRKCIFSRCSGSDVVRRADLVTNGKG